MKTLAVGLLLAVASALASGDELKPVKVKSWDVGFSDAQALVEQVRELLSARGKVTYSPRANKLVVVDIQEKLDLIDQVVREHATPPRNIQIRVQFNEAGGMGNRAGGMSLRQNTVQTLTAGDGGRACLQVTTEYPQPFVTYFYDYCHHIGIATIGAQWRSVGSRLAIQPRSSGNMVRVRLIPELTFVAPGGPGSVAIERLATEVTAQHGQAVQIGGLAQDQEFSSRFFMGFDAGGKSRRLSITLTPFIMEVGGPSGGPPPPR
jgi:hypothetical protein